MTNPVKNPSLLVCMKQQCRTLLLYATTVAKLLCSLPKHKIRNSDLVAGAQDAASGKPNTARCDANKKLFLEDDGSSIVPSLDASLVPRAQQHEGGEQSLGLLTNIGAEWLRQVVAGNPEQPPSVVTIRLQLCSCG
jgi:hypothetical protein